MGVNRRGFLKGTGVTALGVAVGVQAKTAQAQSEDSAMRAKQAATATKQEKPAPVRAQPKARVTGKAGRRRVLAAGAPKPGGPYSQAIVGGGTIYVSGQGPMSPATGNIEVTTFEEQAVQTFENVKAIVEGAGSSLGKVLRVNIYLADLNDFQKMNEVYRRYFTPDFPARTTIGAQLLMNMLIEVDCIAAL
jgi:2-iminobutanoate/2-iminopropanoate deaminase